MTPRWSSIELAVSAAPSAVVRPRVLLARLVRTLAAGMSDQLKAGLRTGPPVSRETSHADCRRHLGPGLGSHLRAVIDATARPHAEHLVGHLNMPPPERPRPVCLESATLSSLLRVGKGRLALAPHLTLQGADELSKPLGRRATTSERQCLDNVVVADLSAFELAHPASCVGGQPGSPHA